MLIRVFDFIFAALGILLLSPLFLVLIIILRLTGEKEIFFFQKRLGQNRKEFMLCKFATMLKDSPNIMYGTITIHNDPRILPFGKFLRKTKINELPQLFNILKGEMSFIGPRPLEERSFLIYKKSSQIIISKLKPGLSGIGSIIFKNEEKIINDHNGSIKFYDEVIMPYKESLEVWFYNKKNIIIYFTLIFITIWTLLFPKSKIIWSIFRDLPKYPQALKEYIYDMN